MRHPTRARRDVLADGGADQRMKELKRPHRREDLRPREPIRGQLGKLRIKLGEPRPEHGLGAGAEHRDRAREGDRVGAHSPEPREHRSPDRRRHNRVQC